MAFTTTIQNLFHTPGTGLALIKNVKKQQAFIRQYIQPDLDEAARTNDGSLASADLKKITDYYGLAIPAIVGESLAVLRGQPLSERERKALTYLGTVTGLFDDFFDKFHLPEETIRVLADTQPKMKGENSAQKLFLDFYRKALENVHDRELLAHYVDKVYEAQIESKKQAMPGLSREEIFKITIQKGGDSVLFYRSALTNPFLPGEEEAIYQIGGLMQFGNDLFDIFKDRNDNIYTLPTTASKIEDIRQLFRNQLDKSFAALGETPYKKANKKKFLRLISLCLCSRCFVVLDQLECKETTTGNVFKPEVYSRQDLICDMDKNINKWRSLRYHLKEAIKIPFPPKF